jgi:membrane-associated phospholipid phosphatase
MISKLKNSRIIRFLVKYDIRLSQFIYDLRPLSTFFISIVRFSTRIFGIVPIFLASILISTNYAGTVLVFALIVLLNALLVEGFLKRVVKRTRPGFNSDRLRTFSFPSTHSSAITMSVLQLLIFTTLYSINIPVLTFCIVWGLLVIFSRVLYGHHYIIDITFGILTGVILSSFLVLFDLVL